MEADGRKRECIEWLAAACLAFLGLAVLWKTSGCIFETNDDSFMSEILSGALGGEPEPHIVYLNYFLTCPLALLYKITIRIPWYGLMFLAFQFLTYTAMLQSALGRRKRTSERILIAGIMVSCFLLNIFITILLEFTSTAAFMAIGGYVCLLLNRDRKRGWLLFCLFEFLAILLRQDAMLMIQPLGMAVCAGELWGEAEGVKSIWLRKTGCLILTVAGVVLLSFLGTVIGYRGEKWKDYGRSNDAIVKLFDYYGTPGYDEAKSILDRYGVSAAEYEAFRQYIFLSPGLGADCLEELAAYMESGQTKEFSVPDILRKGLEMRSDARFYGMGRALSAVFLGSVFWMFLRRRWRMLLPVGFLTAGSVLVEGYLIYRGRLPQRVILPLYFGEIVFMAVILIRSWLSGEENENKKLYRTVICLSALVIAAVCISSGRKQYDSARNQLQWQAASRERLVEIYGYCRVNPEKRYLLDIGVVSDYRSNVLETRLAGWQNCVYDSNWLFHSPVMDDFLREYLSGQEENICLIVRYDEQGEAHPVVAYLAEAMGRQPVPAAQLSISDGEEYLVWSFADM